MNRTATFSAILLCSSLGIAQTYTELPAGYTSSTGQPYDPYLCPASSYIPVHIQYAYALADIPVPVATITELAWHRNNYWGNSMPAGGITTTVTLGLSPNTALNQSTTFASNLVNMVSVVYTGTTSWPAVTRGTGPAPYTHNIMLTTPYLLVAGTNVSFIVDHVMTATTYANSTYTIDAAAPDLGTRNENGGPQSTCKFSTGTYNSGLGYTTGGLTGNGGIWYCSYSGLLPNAPGAIMISGFGLDRPGSYTLPIDLAIIGMPGCRWNQGLEGPWIALTANASGSATLPNINIPPGLGGNWFYDQGAFFDAAANPLGVVSTWPSKWYIGTLAGPQASTVYRIQDTASNPTGTKRNGYGTHLRITR
jgi:hypothetical protein